MQKMPQDVRLVLNSTVPFVVVIILFVILGNFGVNKVLDLRNQITTAETTNTTLTQKLNTLQAQGTSVGQSSSLAAATFPDKNPALTVVSQLKNMAGQSGVTLSAVKGGAGVDDDSGLSRVDVSFDVGGARPQVISFLRQIETFSPITVVGKIKINETGGDVKATVAVKSYFAPFPTKLPAITDAISDLTTDEKSILAKMQTRIQPSFLEVPPSIGGGKQDPFSK